MNTLAQICVGSVWDFTSNHFPLGKQPLFPSLFFLLFTQQDSQNTIFCCRKISINLFSMEFCELRWYKGGCYFDAIHSTERYFILCKIESINQIMEKLSICKFFQAFWSHFWFNTSSRKKHVYLQDTATLIEVIPVFVEYRERRSIQKWLISKVSVGHLRTNMYSTRLYRPKLAWNTWRLPLWFNTYSVQFTKSCLYY